MQVPWGEREGEKPVTMATDFSTIMPLRVKTSYINVSTIPVELERKGDDKKKCSRERKYITMNVDTSHPGAVFF